MRMLQALSAIRAAKEWAGKAPYHRGEFAFGLEAAEPTVFGVFGDSVGCGLGVPRVDLTFAGAVARRLAEQGRVVCRIHAVSGTSGRTLALQRPAGDEHYAAVSIGTNDIVHNESLELLEAAVCRLLNDLKGARRIVVAGPGALASLEILPAVLRPIVRHRVRACEEVLKKAAAQFPNACHFGPSDLGLDRLTPEFFAEDGFHPSEKAHAIIADAILTRLIA